MGVRYLKLADDRGWLFDMKPGVGQMCIREAAEADDFWTYRPVNDLSMSSRSEPRIDGQKTEHRFNPGDRFRVSEVRAGADGVRYLKLADDRGWLFDMKPGVGQMC